MKRKKGGIALKTSLSAKNNGFRYFQQASSIILTRFK